MRKLFLSRYAYPLISLDGDSGIEQCDGVTFSKITNFCRECDIADAVACLRYYAGMADKIVGQSIDTFGGDKLVYTLHQPIGVCGQM